MVKKNHNNGKIKQQMIEGELTEKIIGCAIEVHKFWGPGLYEEIYEKSLCRELTLQGLSNESQLDIPLVYKGQKIGDDLKLDILVEKKVVLELKVVKELQPVHEAQLLTYMRLTNSQIGLLINFNECVVRKGIKRFVL